MFSLNRVLIISAVCMFVPGSTLANEHEHAHAEQAHAEPAHAPVVEHKSHESSPGFFVGVWQSFLAKLEQLQNIDEQNELLRKRNAVLEAENARLQTGCAVVEEHERSEKIKEAAKKEGGVESARTIASLNLADEAMLSHPPKKIYDDALKAFNHGDFETSAKALSFLSTHPENETYQNSSTHYLAAVSLFKVGNYKRAMIHFEHAVKHATGEDVSYAPRAMAWIALCHAKLGEAAAERETVRQLIQKYPKSKEARRLNRHV